MNLKPWKLTLLAALSVSGSAAFAQTTSGADKALELERYNEARAALLKQGQSADALYDLGRLYQMRDMPDSAAYYFSRISLNPKDAKTMVAAGRAALAQGKTAEAEIQFDNAVKATKGKDAKILTLIAQAYAESDVKNITKALTYVEAAHKVNKNKDEPTLMIARGDIYQKSEQGGGEAMSSYERANLADANNVLAHYRKGQLHVRARNYNGAREEFEKVLSLDPNYAPAYNALAETYFYAGKYDEALANFQKYQGLAERTSNTGAKYASFLFLTKKYPEALVEVRNVLATDPNNLTMNRLLAYSLYETGDYAGALAAMDKFLQLAPADKQLKEDNVYYAKILARNGKGDQAIAMLQKAIQADPANADDLQTDLAQAYIAKKDYPSAIATYKAKMKTGTPKLTDQFLLGRVYLSNKQYTQADSIFSLISTARPEYAPGYQMRAQANYGLDPDSKQGLAKPHYEKYIELAKADPAKNKDGLIEANGYLGYYYYQKGEKAASLPYYQQVLALDPNNQNAKTVVNSLTAKPSKAAVTKTPAKK